MKVYRNIISITVLTVLIVWLVFACKMSSETGEGQVPSVNVRTDSESISKGEKLFNPKCSMCHDPNSTEMLVGPGLMGILKKQELPVSKRPAIPVNIIKQLKTPYNVMPSFPDLSEEDIQNIIAYLNTL